MAALRISQSAMAIRESKIPVAEPGKNWRFHKKLYVSLSFASVNLSKSRVIPMHLC